MKRHQHGRRGLSARLAAVLGALVASVGLVTLAAPAASAHVPGATADCSGVRVNLQSYDSRYQNTYTVVMDNQSRDSGTFPSSFANSYAWKVNTSPHHWSVTVHTDQPGADAAGWNKTFSGMVDNCTVTVTPVAPTVSRASQCGVPGTYTIPATAGVTYLLDGKPIAAGTYDGPEQGTVTAQAANGYTLSSGGFSYAIDVPGATACPQVTPVPPTVTKSTQCGVEGSYTVPATEGVDYYLDGKPLSAGTYTGPASGTVTAKARSGYVLEDSGWSYQLDLPAAQACPEGTAVKPTVTQSSKCGQQGSYTIPAVAGVAYLLDGAKIQPGTYAGPARGTITVRASGDTELTNPDFSFALDVAKAEICPKVKGIEKSVGPAPQTNGTPPSALPTVIEAGLSGQPAAAADQHHDLVAPGLLGGVLVLGGAGGLVWSRRNRGAHQR